MGLVISKGLTLRKGYIGTDDPDAEAYIAAVEAADLAADPTAEPLETATKVAIHSFVKGAKADGFWPAIKASCILAGARTRIGALTPLVGAAPTSFNFVDGDYNRKTGLVGDGSTKYLDSNRNNNADPQDSNHNSFFLTAIPSGVHRTMGNGAGNSGANLLSGTGSSILARNRSSTVAAVTAVAANNSLVGATRASSASFIVRCGSVNQMFSTLSQTPTAANVSIFADLGIFSNARIAFYSIGESLDLALLDARVTTLINAFAAAIP
jgi:hypothetical protein